MLRGGNKYHVRVGWNNAPNALVLKIDVDDAKYVFADLNEAINFFANEFELLLL